MDGLGGSNRVLFHSVAVAVEVILQNLAVMYCLYLPVQEGIVCEELGDGVDLLWRVIYV